MRVSEIMTTNPVKISMNATIREAAQKMEELDCGFLPVGSGDNLEGVVTDRDIVVRAVAKGKSPDVATVGEALTDSVLYCFENDDVREAAERMKEEQVYRLLVLNNERDKRLRGVVTLGDISRHTGNARLVGETAQEVGQAGIGESVRRAVNKSRLMQWMDRPEELLVVDVLPKENFERRHIPGAVHIPLQGNPNFVRDVERRAKSKDQRIVVYCAGVSCDLSRRAAQLLNDAGFTDVHAYEGGAEDWFGDKKKSSAAA
jgi:CBS domain-containing protein/rhodanese-related sulfurtransferase